MSVSEQFHMPKQMVYLQNYFPILFWNNLEIVDPFIDIFLRVVKNIDSISVIFWSLFVWTNQLNMFRFIKGKVDTDTNILKVLI